MSKYSEKKERQARERETAEAAAKAADQYERYMRRHAEKMLAKKRAAQQAFARYLDRIDPNHDSPRRWPLMRLCGEGAKFADELRSHGMVQTADVMRELARRCGVYGGIEREVANAITRETK